MTRWRKIRIKQRRAKSIEETVLYEDDFEQEDSKAKENEDTKDENVDKKSQKQRISEEKEAIQNTPKIEKVSISVILKFNIIQKPNKTLNPSPVRLNKERYIEEMKKLPYRDPSIIKVRRSNAYKFSSSERDPTFLYTKSPFTFTNEKIKKEKEIRKIQKGIKMFIYAMAQIL